MEAATLPLAELGAALDAGALVLTPNHRTALQLREQLGRERAAAGLPHVGPSPTLHPVDIWIRRSWEEARDSGRIPPAQLLEPRQELLIWKQVIEQSPAGHAFLNLEAAARRVREAHALLLQWEIPAREMQAFARAQGEALADTGIFLQWLETYEARCRAQPLLSLSQLIPACIEALGEGAIPAPARVVLSGFRHPPPLYRRLFETLAARAQKTFVLEQPSERPSLRKVSAASPMEELEAAALWARDLLRDEPSARIGIVCPDLQQRAREATRVFGAILEPDALWPGRDASPPFTISAGETLDTAPALDAALAILGLNASSADTLTLCRLLRSPFLTGAEEEADARAELEYRLRRKGEARVGLADLRFLAATEDRPWHCPLLARGLTTLETLHRQARGRKLPADWIELLERQLDALGWPGDRAPDRRESAILTRWYEVLALLQGSGFLLEPVEYEGLAPLLRALLRNTTGEADGQAQVQILSPVEAEGLRFSHLWFMGLSERHWPPAARPNPFIPLALQRRHGLPEADPERHRTLADEGLRGILQACGELVLSFARRGDEGEINAAGALLALPGELETLAPATPLQGLHPALHRIVRGAMLENHQSEDHIPLGPATEAVSGGTSLLAAQSGCPFRGFALHRLNARELPAPGAGLSAAARGELLHTALQTFWKGVKDQGSLLALEEEALDARLREAIEVALRECVSRYPRTVGPRLRELESDRLLALLRRWMEKERERGCFQVSHAERDVSWRHADLVLNFRIDRIETYEDGSLGLVDYKSGALGTLRWHEERPENPQLPLYLLAVENEARLGKVNALLFARVNVEDSGFRGITARPGICDGQEIDRQKYLPEGSTWESLRQHWESALQALADEFIAGYHAVQPLNAGTCQYCHLGALCRIGDIPAEEESE